MAARAVDGSVFDAFDFADGRMVTLEGNINARHISVLLWEPATHQPLDCVGGYDFTRLEDAEWEFAKWARSSTSPTGRWADCTS